MMLNGTGPNRRSGRLEPAALDIRKAWHESHHGHGLDRRANMHTATMRCLTTPFALIEALVAILQVSSAAQLADKPARANAR
jgi:hypothetical protein